MKNSVLIVDDEEDVLQLVESNLRRAGYSIMTSKDGRHALAVARHEKPDIMILDIMLPSLSGLDVCKALKGDASMAKLPIIMLSARNEEIDKVVGFELGADDYMAKPFSPRELVLRVNALSRRCFGWQQAAGGNGGPGMESGQLKTGEITLDHDRCEVRVGTSSVAFSKTEFRLLAVLARRPGHVFSREKLLAEVWGYASGTETRAVDMQVLRVREKLGRSADCIETVRGFGYRINTKQAG